jgi:hypothetical protein
MSVAKAIDFLCDQHHDESQRKKAKTRTAKKRKWTENGETE